MSFTFGENDYKHILTDFSSLTVGGRLTYKEILAHAYCPQKFQNIVRIYILKDAEPDMMIGQHLLNITQDDLCYEFYRQLKIKVHFYAPHPKGGYKEKTLKLNDFLQFCDDHVGEELLVQDIIISNLALMGFSV
ncbi:MAG: hypothetical protein MJ105_07625 [Lachnospiraceae bacterium]|nr:hypothetical protein [Lachnospiraceae bacterium]